MASPGSRFCSPLANRKSLCPHRMTFSFEQDASGQVTRMDLALDDGPQVPAYKLPPDRNGMAGLGVFLVLAIFLAAWGLKALRSKG
jgi:hypothetical protein